MGKVGEVGNWRASCIPVPIGTSKYHYNSELDTWYNNDGETDFEITINMDGMRFYFDAGGRRFVDRNHIAVSVDENVFIEKRLKEKYCLDGEVSFFRVERTGVPIYRN